MWRPKRFTTITPTASNAVPSRSRFRASPWGVTLRASNAKYANTRNSTARLTKRSEEHTSELQSPCNLVCRLLLEKKKIDGDGLDVAYACEHSDIDSGHL